MRWKAHFHNKEEEVNEVPENYDLKSLNFPPQIKGLSAFENDKFNLLNIIKFRKVQSEFQRKLKEDKQLINSESKTLNLYQLENEQHNKLLKDSITTTYSVVNKNIGKQINLEGKNIVKDKTIANRILVNGHDEFFISLKDRKPNFTNNPKTRLINLVKNEISRLSKSILDKINNKIRNTTSLNQWKDKSEVINWFNEKEERSNHTFTVFDINLQISPTKNPRVCQNKSIKKKKRLFTILQNLFFLKNKKHG